MRYTRVNLKITILVMALLLTTFSPVQGQARKPAPFASEELHGGIEIGSKGVKAIAVRVSGEDEGYNVKVLYAEVINTTPVQLKDGKVTPEAIRDTAFAVQRFYQRMSREYRVPSDRIHIVGSSGLRGDNLQDLAVEIQKRTGQPVTFLDIDTEVQLSVAGAIPKRVRSGQILYDNRNISVLIDIGSGNTKGGYQQLRQVTVGAPDYDYVTWGITKGTVTFTNEVNKFVGDASDNQTFAKRAQALSGESLRVPIRNEVSRKPGLINRKKVYLSGGIVWAMVTLLRPDDRRSYVPLTPEDITNFYNRAITNPEDLLNPDLSFIKNPALKQEAEKEVESVRNTFTPKNIIAGAEILKVVASEMNLVGKRLLFARFGHLAWILSYVRLQAEP
jgi:hypothetical protein